MNYEVIIHAVLLSYPVRMRGLKSEWAHTGIEDRVRTAVVMRLFDLAENAYGACGMCSVWRQNGYLGHILKGPKREDCAERQTGTAPWDRG